MLKQRSRMGPHQGDSVICVINGPTWQAQSSRKSLDQLINLLESRKTTFINDWAKRTPCMYWPPMHKLNSGSFLVLCHSFCLDTDQVT